MEHLLHARHCGYSKSVSISNLNIWSPHLSSQRLLWKGSTPLRKAEKKMEDQWQLGNQQGPFSTGVLGFSAPLAAL